MRVDLHPLADVPHETIAVDRIDDGPEGDIGVIDEPGVDEHDETQKSDTQPFADASHAKAFSFAILRIIVPHSCGVCMSKTPPCVTVAMRRHGATTAGRVWHPTAQVAGADDANPIRRSRGDRGDVLGPHKKPLGRRYAPGSRPRCRRDHMLPCWRCRWHLRGWRRPPLSVLGAPKRPRRRLGAPPQ